MLLLTHCHVITGAHTGVFVIAGQKCANALSDAGFFDHALFADEFGLCGDDASRADCPRLPILRASSRSRSTESSIFLIPSTSVFFRHQL